MLKIRNVKNLDGTISDLNIENGEAQTIDAEGRLMRLPGLIDPHVHVRTPGSEYKEDWKTFSQAAIRGGVTRVFDMPNNNPPCVNLKNLKLKKEIIDAQLSEVGIPLRYDLYFGANSDSLEDIGKVKDEVIGLKIYMGSSTGGLVMDADEALNRAFQLAGQENILVAVHAEDESILQANMKKYGNTTDPSVHSIIRSREAAISATKQAIALAEKYGTRLLICHTTTKEEIEIIKKAKKNGVLVYCEVSTHHLFLNIDDYEHLKTLALVNPPLRDKSDCEALWKGIESGVVDFIGTDHAPHTLEEKMRPYGKAPSGMPGVETLLPLLLNAYHENKITLEKIVNLTRINIEQIFGLQRTQDYVLVDLEMSKEVQISELKTKCGWSPFSGRVLKGWPVYTILQGKVYRC
ncbi:MAG: dihydroorotase [Chlamydiota bacterium]|nr:dihydroorotase [Chlamydiota bacterium]